MVISQGEVWWADLPEPTGSEAGYRRPVVTERVGRLPRPKVDLILGGIDIVLGRD